MDVVGCMVVVWEVVVGLELIAQVVERVSADMDIAYVSCLLTHLADMHLHVVVAEQVEVET
jgi:hypothetical protein